MIRKTYSEKLLNPKWQKKRLDILNRDKFTCRNCGDTENTLHVHHTYYESNCEPWDYEDVTLITLCKDCHESESKHSPLINKLLMLEINRSGFSISDKIILTAALKILSSTQHSVLNRDKASSFLSNLIADPKALSEFIELGMPYNISQNAQIALDDNWDYVSQKLYCIE